MKIIKSISDGLPVLMVGNILSRPISAGSISMLKFEKTLHGRWPLFDILIAAVLGSPYPSLFVNILTFQRHDSCFDKTFYVACAGWYVTYFTIYQNLIFCPFCEHHIHDMKRI